MRIFADPSNVPIVIVEHVINVPKRSTSGDPYIHKADQKGSTNLLSELKAVGKFSGADHQSRGRILKVVVFVHGFQVTIGCPFECSNYNFGWFLSPTHPVIYEYPTWLMVVLH